MLRSQASCQRLKSLVLKNEKRICEKLVHVGITITIKIENIRQHWCVSLSTEVLCHYESSSLVGGEGSPDLFWDHQLFPKQLKRIMGDIRVLWRLNLGLAFH